MTHIIRREDDDALRFINYGGYGLTVELTHSGQTLDIGFGPEEIPALIEWLTAAQQNAEAKK